VAGLDAPAADSLATLVGRTGVAVTGLFPSGQIEIEGRRYSAMLPLGSAAPGSSVRVTGRSDFGLVVEKTETS
jgi:membrane-bound serine protease (ClpP class)